VCRRFFAAAADERPSAGASGDAAALQASATVSGKGRRGGWGVVPLLQPAHKLPTGGKALATKPAAGCGLRVCESQARDPSVEAVSTMLHYYTIISLHICLVNFAYYYMHRNN